MSDYPTRKELRTIRNWEGTLLELWDYVVARWAYRDWGVKVELGETIDLLELHTAGWSGNESLIYAMERSKSLFFIHCHTKWLRGGHYYFEVPHYLWDYSRVQEDAKAQQVTG